MAEEAKEYFLISVAAELAGMHAQTLRTYDRLGLVTPQRTSGGGRRYTRRDVEVLRKIQALSQEEGVNLAGIKEILALSAQVAELQDELGATQAELQRLRAENASLRGQNAQLQAQLRPRGELVHVPRSTAVVMWERRPRRRSED